jgi:hypothetical protein
VLAKFPALTLGIDHDGLPEPPWLVGRPVEDDPAHSGDAGTRRVGVVDDSGREGAGAKCALLPVGSFEQHGDYLPLITDTVVACVIAQELATA